MFMNFSGFYLILVLCKANGPLSFLNCFVRFVRIAAT